MWVRICVQLIWYFKILVNHTDALFGFYQKVKTVQTYSLQCLFFTADNEANKVYIMMEARINALFKKPEEYTILERYNAL